MQKTYYANGQPVVLTADPGLVAVRFREPAPLSMRAAVAEEHSLTPFPRRDEIPGEKYTILPVGAQPSAAAPRRLESVMKGLDEAREVARVAPVFRVGPTRVVATDRVIVAFNQGAADPRSQLAAKGLEIVEERAGRFVVRLGEYEDPFQVSEELRVEEGVRYAEPDFVIMGTHQARAGDASAAPAAGTLPEAQYALRITRAREALQVQPGRADIRVAILDEGVDTKHPDLRPAFVAEFDAIEGDGYQEPDSLDAHGTACAGLAVARAGAAHGVTGVASGCGLLAVRIARSNPLAREWVTSPSIITRGIDWAVENGADVLSNSWGGGLPSTDVTEAVQRARTEGRGGRGCVVVVSAGNSGGDVLFPGNQAGVLTVSATSYDDEPKKFDSGDGETWWGSCFGPEVQIAAPGVRNYTTDNTSTRGRNTRPSPEGDYEPLFNGTSSSAPIVAGAAALVLCANPALREEQVRQILCETADKVGSEPYQNGRNHRMGNGRVNVLAAVRRGRQAAGPASPTTYESQASHATGNGDGEGAATHGGDRPGAMAAHHVPSSGRKSYLVVMENGSGPDSWQVLRQESDPATILHNRAHPGRPWSVPRHGGDTPVGSVTLRNLRTDALEEGRIYEITR